MQKDSGSEGYGVIRSGGIAGKAYNTYFKGNVNYANIHSEGFNVYAGGIVGGFDSLTTSNGQSSGNNGNPYEKDGIKLVSAECGGYIYGHEAAYKFGVCFSEKGCNKDCAFNGATHDCNWIHENNNE